MFTQHEKKVALALKRQHSVAPGKTAEFALGKILLAGGQITQEHLDQALHNQRGSGLRLGEELIKSGHVNQSQVDIGLLLQRKLIRNALIFSMSLAALPPMVAPLAEAATMSAAMPVSATVIANAKANVEHEVTQIKVLQSDITRGYIDVAGAMRFSVLSNSPNGYLMVFNPVGMLFKSVEVSGLGNIISLGIDGGAIVQRGLATPGQTHELSFRFMLNPDVSPGTYSWPLQLSVRPLA